MLTAVLAFILILQRVHKR